MVNLREGAAAFLQNLDIQSVRKPDGLAVIVDGSNLGTDRRQIVPLVIMMRGACGLCELTRRCRPNIRLNTGYSGIRFLPIMSLVAVSDVHNAPLMPETTPENVAKIIKTKGLCQKESS